MGVLDRELEFFEKNRAEYLKHYPDQFVAIYGNEFLGAYTTVEQAYGAAIPRIGNVPFLIKQVLPEDQKVIIPAYTLGLLG